MTKAPTPTDKAKKQHENTKIPPKSSITERLRTDLRRSVGVKMNNEKAWNELPIKYLQNVPCCQISKF